MGCRKIDNHSYFKTTSLLTDKQIKRKENIMNKRTNKFEKGITLVALVVTIIVLLILAGVTINMAINNQGLISRTKEAKDVSEVENEKETIGMIYNSMMIDKKGTGDDTYYTEEEVEQAVKTYDSEATVSLDKEKYIATLSNGHKYSIYKSGKITEYTTQPYAVDELTVKVSGNSVTSPYYVNYPSAKGTIKCRVLYNDDKNGIQIISVNPVTSVELGKNDLTPNLTGDMGSKERAQSSYNRAITTLNEKANEYMETNDGSLLAIDSRSVGSNPLNKNYPDDLTGDERTAEMLISTEINLNNYSRKIL